MRSERAESEAPLRDPARARDLLLAVVEAAGNDPESFAVVADLVDQAVA